MRVFAVIIMVFSVIGSLIGLLMATTGNSQESLLGVVLLGSGVTSILLCCAVIALADIKKALEVKAIPVIPGEKNQA